MTHTLHRQGDRENLRDDYVVFTMSAKTVNAKGSATKMKRFFEILEKHHPVSYGDMKTGNAFEQDRDTIYHGIQDTSIVHFVFTDRQTVEKVLGELKEEDLGTSVIVSGLVDTVDEMCQRVGLGHLHTVEFSGGIHGKLSLLPEKPVLEVTTMCGHGMVASNLVREMADQVKRGKKSLEEAGIELAKPCQCGVFNPKRAERLLQKLL
jgi:hypothetical protein